MSDNVHVYSGLEAIGGVTFGNVVTELPTTDLKVGRSCIFQDQLWIYQMRDGSLGWIPFVKLDRIHVHIQESAATEWVINHGMGSKNYTVSVFDQNGKLINVAVETIDENNVKVVSPVPAYGRGVFMFDAWSSGASDGPNLTEELIAQIRDRSTHTGTQPISSISGLEASLGEKVDVVSGKQLSTEDYTTAEKNKLAGLESSHFKGQFVDLTALQSAHPTAVSGDYADVDGGVGQDVKRYVWDVSDNAWVMQTGTSTQMTAVQIKASYESNPDTNVFTDAEKEKLATAVQLKQHEAVDVGIDSTVEVNGSAIVSVLGKIGGDGDSSDNFFSGTVADFVQEDDVVGTTIESGVGMLAYTSANSLAVNDVFGDGMITGSYPLDGDATDLGGVNDGVWYGTENYTTGKFGSAAVLDGSSYIDIGVQTLQYKDEFAFSCWIKKSDFDNSEVLIHTNDNNGLVVWEGRMEVIVNGDTELAIDTSLVPVNEFVFLAFGMREGKPFLFINDQKYDVPDTGSNGWKNGPSVQIGAWKGGYNWVGEVDQVRVFERGLTDEEVAQLYVEDVKNYPTDIEYYIYNSAAIDVSNFYVVNNYMEASTQPGGTDIKRLVSFDQGVTWNSWNGVAFVSTPIDNLQTEGNTLAELQAAFKDYDISDIDSITIVYGLMTTVSTTTPTIDFTNTGFSVGTEALYKLLCPTVDYAVYQSPLAGVQTQKVKNKMGKVQDMLINYY